MVLKLSSAGWELKASIAATIWRDVKKFGLGKETEITNRVEGGKLEFFSFKNEERNLRAKRALLLLSNQLYPKTKMISSLKLILTPSPNWIRYLPPRFFASQFLSLLSFSQNQRSQNTISLFLSFPRVKTPKVRLEVSLSFCVLLHVMCHSRDFFI